MWEGVPGELVPRLSAFCSSPGTPLLPRAVLLEPQRWVAGSAQDRGEMLRGNGGLSRAPPSPAGSATRCPASAYNAGPHRAPQGLLLKPHRVEGPEADAHGLHTHAKCCLRVLQ